MSYPVSEGEFGDPPPQYAVLVANDTYDMQFDMYDNDTRVRTAHTKVTGEVFRVRSKPIEGQATYLANVLLTDSTNRWSGNVTIASADCPQLPCDVYVEVVQVLTASVNAATPSGYVERVWRNWRAKVVPGNRT